MRHRLSRLLLCMLIVGFVALTVSAQRPKKKKKETPPPRPTDPKLIELHKEFLTKAEKLASDYERKKQTDKAREVYQAILRLVPKYPRAEQALDRLMENEATKDQKRFIVAANKGWQDSGVALVEGKPVIIEAKGTWTFRVEHKLGPDGIEIPQELRDFNLGSLVGVIVTGPNSKEFKPFLIGSRKEFVALSSGRLMLRMYDSDASDNIGQLSVTIQSTFGR